MANDPSGGPRAAGTRDVEKRWHDPGGFRHAAWFVAAVVAVALVLMVVIGLWTGGANYCDTSGCAGWERYLVSIVPAGVLLLGTLGAFWQTYRVWRGGGAWPIWQGAGWFLLMITLVYVTISGSFVAADQ
ncbi:hypothetical protein DFR70_108227 [Nocardia tenerifensis]|uniref:Uncharacterized protein n=1 Tax=Nocardia tenerifensis TaxID=228006 RepID=A0A318JY27_9NOCA|nr:hypothetical protein [Nocardia tenerifensis]PXX61669.1 hypothetical protein DFR70_108227 [Nocardia tenerifensis]